MDFQVILVLAHNILRLGKMFGNDVFDPVLGGFQVDKAERLTEMLEKDINGSRGVEVHSKDEVAGSLSHKVVH